MAKKTLLLGESKELNMLLEKAHAMLISIDIPVAPLNKIQLRIDGNKRKYHVGTCQATKEGFLILLHANVLEEQAVNGIPQLTFTSILHELLHTCLSDEYGNYGLFVHDNQFIGYAKQIKEAYGYNVMSSVSKQDLPLGHLSVLHELYCPECGAEDKFYSEKTWNKVQQQLENHTQFHCMYCGHLLSYS